MPPILPAIIPQNVRDLTARGVDWNDLAWYRLALLGVGTRCYGPRTETYNGGVVEAYSSIGDDLTGGNRTVPLVFEEGKPTQVGWVGQGGASSRA
jgi:hypothetical protein